MNPVQPGLSRDVLWCVVLAVVLAGCHPFENADDYPFAERDEGGGDTRADVDGIALDDTPSDQVDDGDAFIPLQGFVIEIEEGNDAQVGQRIELRGQLLDESTLEPVDAEGFMVRWEQIHGLPVSSIEQSNRLDGAFVITPGSGVSLDPPDLDVLGRTMTFQVIVCLPDDPETCGSVSTSFTIVAQETAGVHVAEDGDDGGDGSKSAPVRSLARGLQLLDAALAGGVGVRGQLRVAEGTYPESIALIDGVDLLGGYSRGDWRREAPRYETRLEGQSPVTLQLALEQSAQQTVLIDGVTVIGAERPGDPNSIAVLVQSNAVILHDVVVYLGDASSVTLGVLIDGEGFAEEGFSPTFPPSASLLGVSVISPESRTPSSAEASYIGLGIASASASVEDLFVEMALKPANYLGVVASNSDPTSFTRPRILMRRGEGEAYGDVLQAGMGATGSTVVVTDGEITHEGGTHEVIGVVLNGLTEVGDGLFETLPNTVTFTRTTIRAGDAVADFLPDSDPLAAEQNTVSSIALSNIASVVVLDGSTLESGDVLGTGRAAQPSLSIGALCITGSLTLQGSNVDAASADIGSGVFLYGLGTEGLGSPISVEIKDSMINQGRRCATPALSCTGIKVDSVRRTGEGGADLEALLNAESPPSCCDPALYTVVVERSQVRGGDAAFSTALSTGDSPFSLNWFPPSVCVNASTLEGGDCARAPGGATQCHGAYFGDATHVMLHNNMIFGGAGAMTTGVSFIETTGLDFVANNYIHGGYGSTRSRGLSLHNDGVWISNNLIDAGTSLSDAIGIIEARTGSQPAAVLYNDFVFGASESAEPGTSGTWYQGCAGSDCGFFIYSEADWDGMLLAQGSTAPAAGGNFSDAVCLEDHDPTSPSLGVSPGSSCDNGGLDLNELCVICGTPWASREGDARPMFYGVLGGFGGNECVDAIALQPSLAGDGVPSVGPGE